MRILTSTLDHLRRHPWQRRLLLAIALTGLLVLGWNITWALAEGGRAAGQGNPALSFIQVKDSHGINAWNYELSLDRGGVLAPDKMLWSFVTDFMWGSYRDGVLIGIWFLDWVMSFEWMGLFTTPLLAIGDTMEQVVARFGLVPVFLTCTAAVGAFYILRGKWSTGIYEIMFALVLASMLTGFLAHPVRLVAAPETGLIYQTRDFGLDFVAAMTDTGNAGSKGSREALTGQLVDVFLRMPHQLVNFGDTLDGGPCEQTYTDVIKAGPYGTEPTIRDKVNECDEALGAYAATPTYSMVLTVGALAPAVALLLVTGALIGGTIILAAAQAAYQGTKGTLTSLAGLLPGVARGSFFMTVALTLLSLASIAITFIFFAIYLQVLYDIFGGPQNTSERLFAVSVFMVIALIVFATQRRKLKASADRLANLMATRPGGVSTPHRMPDVGMGLMRATAITQAAHTAASMLTSTRRRRSATGGATGHGYQDLPEVYSPTPAGTGGQALPPSQPPGPTNPTPRPRPGGGGGGATARALPPGSTPSLPHEDRRALPGSNTARQLAGTAATYMAQAALGYVTGGSSTVVLGAMRLLPRRPKLALPPGSSAAQTPAIRPVQPALPSGRRPIAALPPGPSANPSGPTEPNRPSPTVPSPPSTGPRPRRRLDARQERTLAAPSKVTRRAYRAPRQRGR